MANDEFREQQEALRKHGLASRQETRVERAREREAINELCESVAAHMSSVAGIYYVPQTSTDEAYDKLARAAVDVTRPAIRRQVAEEIAAAIEAFMRQMASASIYDQLAMGSPHNYLVRTVEIAREVGAKETS